MTTEFVQNNEYDEVNVAIAPVDDPAVSETEIVPVDDPAVSETEIVPVDTAAAFEFVTVDDTSATESAEATESTAEVWRSIQATLTAVFANATSYTTEFFKNNRPLLTMLGWIFLAFLAARLLFAAVDAVDDIPLVTPILKLIGLVYVVRFIWRYLLRQHDRQEFMQTLDRVKAEVFGNQG